MRLLTAEQFDKKLRALMDFFELNNTSPQDAVGLCLSMTLNITGRFYEDEAHVKALLDEFFESYKKLRQASKEFH